MMINKHLDKLVICYLECSIWSGRKKLHPEDFGLTAIEQLPSSEVASLGSKKICDPKVLNQFERLKKEAQRCCEALGIRFLGGYAIPEKSASTLSSRLKEISERFERQKAQFVTNYDQITQEWIEKHPDFSDAILRAIVPVHEVKNRFQFDFTLYQLQATASAIQEQLKQKISQLNQKLFESIAKEANELFQQSFHQKDQTSQRVLTPLRRLQQKLYGLSFLDRKITPIVNTVHHVLSNMPTTGCIDKDAFITLKSLVWILADSDKIQLHGQGKLSLDTMIQHWQTLSTHSPSLGETNKQTKILDDITCPQPSTEKSIFPTPTFYF